MCEFAPGSPFFKVGGSIDTEGNSVNERHFYRHARFKGAQLFELLALFQRRGRQRNKARQRVAAISIKADVMIERPLAPGCGGAGEIKGAGKAGAAEGGDRLDHVRVCAFFIERNFGGQSRNVCPRTNERLARGADQRRVERRQVALHIEDNPARGRHRRFLVRRRQRQRGPPQPPRPGARPERSSAPRKYRPEASPAGAWRPCGRGPPPAAPSLLSCRSSCSLPGSFSGEGQPSNVHIFTPVILVRILDVS